MLIIYTDRPPLAPNATGDLTLSDDRRKESLSTLRNKKYYEDEPIATGPLLARWLAKQFTLTNVAGDSGSRYNTGKKACWVNVYQAVTTFEGHDINGVPPEGAYHYPLTLSVARSIDLAVKNMAEAFSGTEVNVILSHTGGPADIKECLNASARFRFGDRIIESHESELQAVGFNFDRDKTLSRTPRRSDSLTTRLHVEQRIWEGDYVGAQAVASHIQPDGIHDTWGHAVRATHDLFLGLDDGIYCHFPAAEKIWNQPEQQRDIMLVAFRVEAALQHDKGTPLVTEAVKGLITLRDVLISRFLINQLKSRDIIIDPYSAEVIAGSEYILEHWIKQRWIVHNEKLNTSKLNPAANMVKFTKCLLKETDESPTDHPLIKFHKAIHDGKNSSLTYFRNRATHSTLTQIQVEKCRELGKNEKIWKIQKE